MKLLKIKTNKETRYSNSDGKRHRNNGPAIIYPSGTQVWYRNDKPHRDNDLPASIYSHGYKEWWVNGEFIRYEIT